MFDTDEEYEEAIRKVLEENERDMKAKKVVTTKLWRHVSSIPNIINIPQTKFATCTMFGSGAWTLPFWSKNSPDFYKII